jgi:hypothetical protein
LAICWGTALRCGSVSSMTRLKLLPHDGQSMSLNGAESSTSMELEQLGHRTRMRVFDQ